MLRTTYTYALLEVSEQTYYEIYDKLSESGYDHCFHKDGDQYVIDMHGLALTKEEKRDNG